LSAVAKLRHAELGSASIAPRGLKSLEAKWTLNQVQGDDVFWSKLRLQPQPNRFVQPSHDVEVLYRRAASAFAEIVEHREQPHL